MQPVIYIEIIFRGLTALSGDFLVLGLSLRSQIVIEMGDLL